MPNYAPSDKCLWDAWFIRKDDEFHMFHLQAPWPDRQEDRHHDAVEIGHAVSKDLVNWTEQPVALRPGAKGEWDDLALWTGSVIEKDSTFYMFYTARKKEEFFIQKIGLATSKDLINWTKHSDNPILEHHPGHYHMEDALNELGTVPAWRDPFVFKDPKSGRYFMTVSARKKGPKKTYNGCVALAESHNMVDWTVHPPILAPGHYDEMETTQVIFHNNLYYLFFSTHAAGYHPDHAAKHGAHSGLHCYYSGSIFGPYTPVNNDAVVIPNGKEMYDIRLIRKSGNEFTAIGWLNKDKDGKFIGRLSHPFTIVIDGDRVYRKE